MSADVDEVERVEFRPAGAMIVTRGVSSQIEQLKGDFYVGLVMASMGLVSTVFLLYADVPQQFRTNFLYVVLTLTVLSFRAGQTYSNLMTWIRK